MRILVIVFIVVIATFLGLQAWRWSDNRRATLTWQNLSRRMQAPQVVFDPAMVQGLPEPARRYFLFTIKPGTVLCPVAEIEMTGSINLGTQDAPNTLPMCARQIIAAPHGLVWALRAGRGTVHISGSDGIGEGQSWTRFWLLGTIPVVRAGGDPDHLRSAFGRVVAESIFFVPAALLKGAGVTWEALGDNVARATVCHNGLTQAVDVTVADNGRPTMVAISRWSNANPEKRYQLQPFGGYLSAFREFDGYMLPTRIEGGNFIGTAAYFPFYQAEIERLRPISGNSKDVVDRNNS